MFQKALQNKITLSLLLGTLVLCHVLWEYFNGGVTAHHLLARADMPAFSNWWGLLTIPLLSYFLLYLADRRLGRIKDSEFRASALGKAGWGFLISLAFGLCMSLLWELRFEEVLAYLIYIPFLAALFIPVYRPEYLLGFVLGMAYTFGGVLPILIGFVLVVISFVIHKVIRGGVLWLLRKGKKDDG